MHIPLSFLPRFSPVPTFDPRHRDLKTNDAMTANIVTLALFVTLVNRQTFPRWWTLLFNYIDALHCWQNKCFRTRILEQRDKPRPMAIIQTTFRSRSE